MGSFISFLTQKTVLGIAVIMLLTAGVVGSVYVTQRQTQLQSKADFNGCSYTCNMVANPSTIQSSSSTNITVGINRSDNNCSFVPAGSVSKWDLDGDGNFEITNNSLNQDKTFSDVAGPQTQTLRFKAVVESTGQLVAECATNVTVIPGTTDPSTPTPTLSSTPRPTTVIPNPTATSAPPASGGIISSYGTLSVGKTTINKTATGWENIRITGSVSIPGANDSKTIAGIYVAKTSSVATGSGWTPVTGHFFGSNGPIDFEWTPPASFTPDSYTFGLFYLDGVNGQGEYNVVDRIAITNPVQFVTTSASNNSAICQNPVFKNNGQVVSFLQEGKTYDVEIRVDNNGTAAWNESQKYRLGYPTVGDNFFPDKINRIQDMDYLKVLDSVWPDPTERRLRIPAGTSVNSGSSYTFPLRVQALKSGNGIRFYWNMVKDGSGGEWFGGGCETSVNITASGDGGQSATGTVIPSPTTVDGTREIMYRIAAGNTIADAKKNLDSAVFDKKYKPGGASGVERVSYDMGDVEQNGIRFVAVQFKKEDGTLSEVIVSPQIQYVGAGPTISNIECHQALSGTGTVMNITGSNLGAKLTNSVVKVKGKTVAVDNANWKDNQITVNLSELLSGESEVEVITSDNRSIKDSCTIGVTTASLVVKNVCNIPITNLDIEVEIFANVPANTTSTPLVTQKVKSDRSGKLTNFAPKLEAPDTAKGEKSKKYSALVKAPKTITKKVDFEVIGGTKTVEVILPIGDVAPIGGDGIINASDGSKMLNEWSLLSNVSRESDLNGDGRVNSFDYTCLIKKDNYGETADEFKPPVLIAPTPTATTTPILTTSPTVSPTP